VNRSAQAVVLLEVGDRTPGDLAEYPYDDLAILPVAASATPGISGPLLRYSRKDGTPYE